MSNNISTKGSSNLNTIQRTIGSERLKRPSKEPASLATSSKKPFLKEYSIAMVQEEKLQYLKQKINQKKKQKTKEQKILTNQKGLDVKLQKFIKTKNKPSQKNIQQAIQIQLIKQKFHEFLALNNLLTYKNLLFENLIDSLEILAEATQKQLEEIGIPKGHALKLKVNIAKLTQNQSVQSKQKNLRQTKTKDSQRNKSFVSEKPEFFSKQVQKPVKQQKVKSQSICIGTEDDGLESIRFESSGKPIQVLKATSKFCLFCYQSIKIHCVSQRSQFCCEDCADRYNQMFKKYEKNLMKAQEEFKTKDAKVKINSSSRQINQEQNHETEQEQEDFIDLLDQHNEFYEDFNYQNYHKLKKQLGNL